MRNARVWLAAALFITVGLAGTVSLVESAKAQPAAPANHWRYFDGHWSYWDGADGRWYYTDGEHWFFHDGKVWAPYHFDRKFGREGFERGEYKFPGEGVKVVVPRHGVYVHHR